MKKFLSMILVTVLTMTILFSTAISAYAVSDDDGIMPCYTNCTTCETTFTISNSGVGSVDVLYSGISGSFREARVTVKIQKKFLLFFWQTVDIGYTDNEWVASSTEISGYLYNSFELDGGGTYKAVFTVEIFGNDGSVDVIEKSIEQKN